MLEELREVAGLGGPAAVLANDLLVIREQYEQGELSVEEYQYLVNQIAEVRAGQDLANDEQAFRYIVTAANALSILL
jgi:hypothetical protein